MRYSAILATALAATVFAAPAAAAESTASVAVSYADLDLSTQAGQERLERRIDSAARAACGLGEIRTGTRMPSSAARRCYEQTKAGVHQRMAERIARESSRG